MSATHLSLVLGVVVLTGQISSTDPGSSYSISSNSNPNPASGIPGDQSSDDATRYPIPVIKPKPVQFTISPGTIRQGYDYTKLLKSKVVLSGPALADYAFRVVSSDPTKITCSNITVPKGATEGEGTVKVNWVGIDRDCRVGVKAYSPDNPLDNLWYTVSVRRDSSIPIPTPAGKPGASPGNPSSM